MSWFSEIRKMRREYREAVIASRVADEKVRIAEQRVQNAEQQVEWFKILQGRMERLEKIQAELGQFIETLERQPQ